MNIPPGWFSERSQFWPGQAQSLEMDEVLFDEQSDFQHNLVFKSKAWGTVLCLDGCIQVTDHDEMSYHENMANIPLFSHADPKRVLIIGGGDGGVMREVLRSKSVEHCTLCDIDKMVIDVSKKFFPKLAVSFSDPRAEVIVGDGFKFLENKVNEYDVVIVDSSDPVGPASTLFNKEFFSRCYRSLRKGGILCTQAECIWLHLDMIADMIPFIKDSGFGSVEYCNILMPSYPSGCIGFFLCREEGSCKIPVRDIPEDVLQSLRYYDQDMHKAAFVLPRFVTQRLAASKTTKTL